MLIFFSTISVVLMILLPVVLAGYLRRHKSGPWVWFSLGMATFTVSQLIHFPLNNWLEKIGLLNSPAQPGDQSIWQIALLLGLTAGLCEELVRAAGYLLVLTQKKRQFSKSISLSDGLMAGLGHGGIESMVFGGVLSAATFAALTPFLREGISPAQLSSLPSEQAQILQVQIDLLLTQPWNALLPLVQRLIAMGLHVSLSLMVLLSVNKRKPFNLILAIVYHMLVDAVAVVCSTELDNGWVINLVLLLAALPGYLWLWLKIKSEPTSTPLHPNPLPREFRLFLTSLSKELFQLWRTKRFLVVGAVFGLFGLASPMMAYFMPQLMTAIPGAEAFASLIPTPTAGDAVTQYHKNITQFIFLLAIVLGMGSVAGEKERGTATLVLSKPLPRWAFLGAKLAAQFLLFLGGIALATFGGYLYTFILFGDVDIKNFINMNLVLIPWIFSFIALTMLGSVIGATTSAAGGISLALVVLLLLSSSLPVIGSLMPGTLSGWAAQLGILSAGVAASTPGSMSFPDGPVPANLGALASALVLIVVCLVISFAFFEQQGL